MLDDCHEIMSYDTGQWLELKRVMCQTLRMQSKTGNVLYGTNAVSD